MELKPGYKQTEAGVIPEDWDVKALSRLPCEAIDCHHSTPIWKESGEIVIRNQNIRDGRLNLADTSYTDEKAYQERIRRAVPSHPDLVITREAPMGEVCMIPAGLKCCLGQRMVLLRIQSDNVDQAYVLYALQAQSSRRFIGAVGGTGSTVSNIRIPILKSLPVAVPAPSEQKKISAALGDINELIIHLERLVLKKHNIKQATMQELLTGKRRLPGFEGEWEVKRLGSEIRHLQAGVSVTSTTDNEQANTDHYVLKTSAVFQGRFMPAEKKQIIPGEVKRAKTSIRKGDLIISRMNTPALVGECGYSDSDHPNLFLPDRLWRADCRDPRVVSSRWITYALSMQQNRLRIKDLATGTSGSMKNISKHSLLDLEIEWPSFTEQVALAAVLSEMDNEIDLINEQLQKANSIKQGMMQQLLTGKIRLT
jgi:type I restriction enzyme S subunit